MAELKVDVIRCASCSGDLPVTEADLRIESENRDVSAEDAIVRACARHLMFDCPRRYMGHEAFGAEARWNRLGTADRCDVLEIAWTNNQWGMPFQLWKVPGYRPGVVGHSDWRLD